ncbi:hypothetical protein NDU88_003411 [Pleurodeles waltl]|uniref:Tick transposon n=1 Tax=Pleurodeles waltl TaxID=8319 RepID=A0AAV7WRC8_PLEWA|nr:hypothetical protein NDU88_003411 [Pleurodeles waltl]
MWEIKLTREDASKSTNEQLSLLNTNLQSLNKRVTPVEQRVSDLEDFKSKTDSDVSKLQTELVDLQLKLDDLENRSCRSNLHFVGVPEGRETGTTVMASVADLINKYVRPSIVTKDPDFTIIRGNRVPLQQNPSFSHPLTILVNFSNYRIIEQLLSSFINDKVYRTADDFSFRIYSGIAITAAKRWKEMKNLIKDFKTCGAPAGGVQQSKLKVLYLGMRIFNRLWNRQKPY